MRRRRYVAGVVNPFLPTETYEAQRQSFLETGSLQAKQKKSLRRQDRVVTLRINPIDCLSILDYIEKIGESTVNMSFAQCVKITLASALETFRRLNYIPTPDGFAFLERMNQFGDVDNRVAMLNTTGHGNQPEFQAKPLFEDPAVTARRRRYEELMIKHKAAPESFDEIEELAALIGEFQ